MVLRYLPTYYRKRSMAKRANPFLGDYVQQSKIHVGLKQFNNNEHRLQTVYEKTLRLLLEGAKRPAAVDSEAAAARDPHSHPGAATPTPVPVLGGPPSAHRMKLKQLTIGTNGALLHHATLEERGGGEGSARVGKPGGVAERCACRSGSGSGSGCGSVACAYCERALCLACGRLCARCRRVHCARCSLPGGEGEEEVCVSCCD